MKLLERILFAQDFTEASKKTEQTAIELARIFQSKVVPIHVLPEDIMNPKVKSLLNKMALEELQKTVVRIMQGGVEVGNPILEFGSAHECIVKTAVQINANLILTGSGEYLGKDRFLLGTTTQRIIQNSEKPVMVIKSGIPLSVHHILCPVDFSMASARALKNAITMTRRFRAELTILSVCEVEEYSWSISEKVLEEENETRLAKHNQKFDWFLKEFNLSDLNWTKEILKGNPAEEIRNTISRKMIDLLIMGTAGRTGLNRLIIGSVTEKVIREVPCSFLTLKSEDVINLKLHSDITDFENNYQTAQQLMKDGFYEESISQFKACLSLNNMHVPSYNGIAKVYEKMGDLRKAKLYRAQGNEIKDRKWYVVVEDEVRKLRGH